MIFCKRISWNLYISSSAYAKYYFALRSLTEKKDFRRYVTNEYQTIVNHLNQSIVHYRNYNAMVVNAPGADIIETRSGEVRQNVLDAMTLSRSL
jgi:hypothetical protein